MRPCARSARMPEFRTLPILALTAQGDEGRPREVPRRRRQRLHRQAGQHRSAPLADARVAVPLNAVERKPTDAVDGPSSTCIRRPASPDAGADRPRCRAVVADGRVNILIVDDEPKNLTVLETILDDPGYRLVRAESRRPGAARARRRGLRPAHPRHPHARHERLRAGADDQAAQEDGARADHLPHRLLQRRPARARGLRHRRGGLPAQAGQRRRAPLEGRRLRRAAPQEPRAGDGQPRAAARSDRAPARRGAAARAERVARSARDRAVRGAARERAALPDHGRPDAGDDVGDQSRRHRGLRQQGVLQLLRRHRTRRRCTAAGACRCTTTTAPTCGRCSRRCARAVRSRPTPACGAPTASGAG